MKWKPKTNYQYGDAFDNIKSKRFIIFFLNNPRNLWASDAHRFGLIELMALVKEMELQKLNSGWEKKVIDFCNSNQFTKAVEVCRQYTGLSLRDSIKKVEKIIRKQEEYIPGNKITIFIETWNSMDGRARLKWTIETIEYGSSLLSMLQLFDHTDDIKCYSIFKNDKMLNRSYLFPKAKLTKLTNK